MTLQQGKQPCAALLEGQSASIDKGQLIVRSVTNAVTKRSVLPAMRPRSRTPESEVFLQQRGSTTPPQSAALECWC